VALGAGVGTTAADGSLVPGAVACGVGVATGVGPHAVSKSNGKMVAARVLGLAMVDSLMSCGDA
jgi:hypothetical protein